MERRYTPRYRAGFIAEAVSRLKVGCHYRATASRLQEVRQTKVIPPRVESTGDTAYLRAVSRVSTIKLFAGVPSTGWPWNRTSLAASQRKRGCSCACALAGQWGFVFTRDARPSARENTCYSRFVRRKQETKRSLMRERRRAPDFLVSPWNRSPGTFGYDCGWVTLPVSRRRLWFLGIHFSAAARDSFGYFGWGGLKRGDGE